MKQDARGRLCFLPLASCKVDELWLMNLLPCKAQYARRPFNNAIASC